MAIITKTLKPYQIWWIQNLTPNNVAYIQDDPAAPDANNLVPIDASIAPTVEIKFDNISGLFTGTQKIRVHFVDPNWVGLHIEVFSNGTKVYTSPISYNGYNNLVAEFTFDASVLTDKYGTNVSVRIIGHIYNGLTISSIRAASWVATLQEWEYIRTGTSFNGYNSGPYNQQMFNAKGAKIYAESSISGTVNVNLFGIKRITNKTSLTAVANLVPSATKRTPGKTNISAAAILGAYGIRREYSSTLLKVIGLVNSSGYRIVGGKINLTNTIIFSSKSFKYGFARSLLENESDINARSGALLINNADLITSFLMETVPLKRLYESFSLIGESSLTVDSIIKAIGLANLQNTGILVSAEPFLYRWIAEQINEGNWELNKKPSTKWEEIQSLPTDWKRVIK